MAEARAAVISGTGVAGSCFDSWGEELGLSLSSSVAESDAEPPPPTLVILVTRHGEE